MMYQVNYMKPKKKGYAQQKATFLKIEDAVFWEEHVKKNLGAVGKFISDSVLILGKFVALNEILVRVFTLLKFLAVSNQVQKCLLVLLELFQGVTHVTHLFDSVNIHGIDGLWEISGQ